MAEVRASMEHPEMNKILVRRFFDEYLSTGDLDHVDELVSYDLKQHGVNMSDGIEGLKAYMAPWYAAFPDLRFDILDMIAQGDLVGVRVRVGGTNSGEFMGRPPSNRKVEFIELDLFELEGEKIVAHWGVADTYAMHRQLGIAPP